MLLWSMTAGFFEEGDAVASSTKQIRGRRSERFEFATVARGLGQFLKGKPAQKTPSVAHATLGPP